MLLGIDVGTRSVKVVALEPDGNLSATESEPYSVASPKPGWAETDAVEWWDACVRAVKRIIGRCGNQISAVGLSGQMHGVVLCDEDGSPLRPAILWADTRSVDELRSYRELPEHLRLRLANPPYTGMAGPSLLWLRSNEPDIYRSARHALQPKDWLRLQLTGSVRAEPSDASATLLFDVTDDRWSHEVISALGLERDLVAPLVPSASVAGELHKRSALELGLAPGTPVAAGAADTAAAGLGTGVVDPGAVQLTVGTGAQIVAPKAEPTVDHTLRTHLYCAAAPERWYAMAAVQNAGLALEWVRKVMAISWEQYYAESFAAPPGSGGVVFIPHLTGERTPHLDPEARGAWAGVSLNHGRPNLLRAALEGVAFAIREALDALEATGLEVASLRLAGGGSLDPRWRQLLADVLGRPLFAVPDAAASGRGAALLGGIASGELSYEDVKALAPPTQLAAAPVDSDLYTEPYSVFSRSFRGLRDGRRAPADFVES